LRKDVSIGVTAEEEDLEEKHAGGPDAGTATEPGEDVFADKGLDLEEEKSAEEDGEGVGGQRGESVQCSVVSIQCAAASVNGGDQNFKLQTSNYRETANSKRTKFKIEDEDEDENEEDSIGV